MALHPFNEAGIHGAIDPDNRQHRLGGIVAKSAPKLISEPHRRYLAKGQDDVFTPTQPILFSLAKVYLEAPYYVT